MIIDCISDLHGFYPKLEGGGDLLIICGDLTANDRLDQLYSFLTWYDQQKYRKKVLIAGNHDNLIQREEGDKTACSVQRVCLMDIYDYLQDSGTEFEGLRIWGSPWTKRFVGQNPACMAFSVETEEELAKKWEMIPKDTDILVTHTPPEGQLDGGHWRGRYGSKSLANWLHDHGENIKLHVFGHIHSGSGIKNTNGRPIYVNAAIMDDCYHPRNSPIRVIL